jgi:hypothetical protein
MPDWLICAAIVIVFMVLLFLVVWWRVEACCARDKNNLLQDRIDSHDETEKKSAAVLSSTQKRIDGLDQLNEALAKKCIPSVASPEIEVQARSGNIEMHLKIEIQQAFELCGNGDDVSLFLAQFWGREVMRKIENRINRHLKDLEAKLKKKS